MASHALASLSQAVATEGVDDIFFSAGIEQRGLQRVAEGAKAQPGVGVALNAKGMYVRTRMSPLDGSLC